MEKEKLGVETIKQDLGIFIDLGLQVAEILKDKKVTPGEGISLAFKIPTVWKAAKSLPEFVAELKDVDPTEAQQILEFLVEKYGGLLEKKTE